MGDCKLASFQAGSGLLSVAHLLPSQGSPECTHRPLDLYTGSDHIQKGARMSLVTWKQMPPTSWVAVMNGQPLCTLKGKDIGGWTACWEGERVWPPPAHLPKAMPQPTKYFGSLDEAKAAVEKVLGE